MPDNPAPARKHCSLREALEIVGKCAFPAEWTGHEADLSPAKDFATLRRCVRSTRALLALLHDGRVTAWFIFDGSTLEEQRRKIIPSEWPNPANFLARLPFGNLWFDLMSSRGALRPKPEDSPAWYQRFANTPLWHAYSPLVGRIELDEEALRLACGDGTGQASAVVQEPEEDSAAEATAGEDADFLILDPAGAPDPIAEETVLLEIEDLLPDAPLPSPSQKNAQKPRRGRKPGSGAYTDQDRVLWKKMKGVLEEKGATSPWDATRLFVKEMPGRGTDDSKRRRLLKGYNGWIPNQ